MLSLQRQLVYSANMQGVASVGPTTEAKNFSIRQRGTRAPSQALRLDAGNPGHEQRKTQRRSTPPDRLALEQTNRQALDPPGREGPEARVRQARPGALGRVRHPLIRRRGRN